MPEARPWLECPKTWEIARLHLSAEDHSILRQWFEGLAFEEIAKRMKLDAEAVRSRWEVAIIRLQSRLRV